MVIGPSGLWIFHKIQKVYLTNVSCNICVQSGENDSATGKVFWDTFLHDEGTCHYRNRRSLFPVHRLGIKFPGRSGGGSKGVDDEPSMVGEQRDESLANCASGSEDTDLDGLRVVRQIVREGGGHFRGGEVGGRL